MMQTQFQEYHVLHYQALWLAMGVGLILMVAYLSLTGNPPEIAGFDGADKLGHAIAYGVLMGWFGQIYRIRLQLILIAFAFASMGVVMEYLQGMSGNRTFEYADMAANSVGVLIGWWLTVGWLRGTLHKVEAWLGIASKNST